MTALNLIGVKASARANKVLLAIMSVVVVASSFGMQISTMYTAKDGRDCFRTEPLYNPKTFNSHKILTATSFAALTYIGFDGVTTLAEDVENPKRNVLLAVVLTCIFAGVCSAFEAYLGARVWPDWHTFPNLETAFMDICSRVGGVVLFNAMGVDLDRGSVRQRTDRHSGRGATAVWHGPRRRIARRNSSASSNRATSTPTNNILLIGGIGVFGAVRS